MKKLVVLFIGFIAFLSFTNFEAYAQPYSKTKSSPADVRTFFKLKSIYRHYPNKKIVMYESTTLQTCPASRAFAKEMQSIIANPQLANYYEFVKRPNSGFTSMSDADYYKWREAGHSTKGILPKSMAESMNNVYDVCGFFCVIDENYNIIYAKKSIGVSEAKGLSNVLNRLK